MEATAPRRQLCRKVTVVANIFPRRPALSLSSTSRGNLAVAREKAAVAIAISLHRQIHTAWMLLQTANRFPTYEGSHERFVKSSARVLSHAEKQLWQVELDQADLVQLTSNVAGLWFAIDALL
jgi:hypothetical protein